jgi:LPS O-antigen subunit length determinant protein (WzzB/FepE family)
MEKQTTLKATGPIMSHDPDEINLLEYFYALVHRKKWIIGVTIVGLFLGFVAAKVKGPTWVAEAIIAPKETESQKTPSFAGLGALGGLVASQLNLGGNASLDKIDIILDSREFNAALVEKNNLLPSIYKYQSPKAFKKYWDPAQQKWTPEFIQPKFLDMGGMVKGYLKKVTNKNNTMTIKIQSKDSTFTINLANNYVTFLNDYIKTNVKSDARENVEYLDKQLNGIADPLLREKIQALIANEIEKQMVVSKEAFRVVDPVYMTKTFKEKKLYPLVFGFGLFFLSCLLVVFFHAFSSADKTEEDKILLEKIKKELFLAKK